MCIVYAFACHSLCIDSPDTCHDSTTGEMRRVWEERLQVLIAALEVCCNAIYGITTLVSNVFIGVVLPSSLE